MVLVSMLRLAMLGVGGGGELVGEAVSLPFARSVATLVLLVPQSCVEREVLGWGLEQGGEGKGRLGRLTSVEVRLLGQLVVRVAVGVDGAVELLKGHKRLDQLVVGVEEAAQPLL